MAFAGFSAEISIAILLALITIFFVAVLVGLLDRDLPKRLPSALSDTHLTVFLFDGPILLDATPAARRLIESLSNPHPDLDQVGRILEARFPGISAELMAPDPANQVLGRGADQSVAVLDRSGESLRITIRSRSRPHNPDHVDLVAVDAMRSELATLRYIGESAPQLIWKVDNENAVTWANRSYLEIVDRVSPPRPGLTSDWPPAPIFASFPDSGQDPKMKTARLSVEVTAEDSTLWFDVSRQPCPDGHLYFAIPADAIVQAEAQNKLFVQTLTKTFAELSTGLAIFDRSRKLVMFNPALVDLTRLPVSFLSSRPVFGAVLDRLRNGGILPEPKNYTSWREEITALETKAQEGTYCETWTLATGEIYRVTGRPHPDGALAFLIEDISAEIMLTRNYRAELATAHSVLDTLDEAMAVFSRTGQLVMSNLAFDEHWASFDSSPQETSLHREIEHWKKIAVPTPLWDRIAAIISDSGMREALRENIRLGNGQLWQGRVIPLSGGAVLVGFALVEADGAVELAAEVETDAIQESATG